MKAGELNWIALHQRKLEVVVVEALQVNQGTCNRNQERTALSCELNSALVRVCVCVCVCVCVQI